MYMDDMLAKISEIFISYQGEGTFMGSRQLFVRFYDCNMSCAYCDTVQKSYKTFTKEALLGKILDFDDDYNELVLTGGEPLLYSGFLKTFLPLFINHRKHPVYLETNGTLPGELKKIISFVDIVAMDIKLPSSSGAPESIWKDHSAFMGISEEKELIVKAVVTGSTTMDDIKKMTDLIKRHKRDLPVVLQPVMPPGDTVPGADEEMTLFFKEYMKKETGNEIVVLGQMHKYANIK
jgi:7-carboxy-7-deazaguanine synthase